MARIDYQTLLDNALKSVVKDALVHAQFNGMGDGTINPGGQATRAQIAQILMKFLTID